MAKATDGDKSRSSKEEPVFPLLDYLDELVDRLRRNIPKALKEFDVDGVHDARVSTRRLKAALSLLAQVLSNDSQEPFSRALKKLRRRLGPLRDLDVMIEHLEEVSATGRHALAAAWMTRQLEKERADARQESSKHDAASAVLGKIGAWWGVREEVAEAEDAADNLLAQSLHLRLDEFAEQADHLSAIASGENEKEDAGRPDPHGLRISGKALRYTLEMAREQGHELPANVASAFKRMQDCLGIWHDYVVLTETSMRLSTSTLLAHHDSATQRAVLDLARDVLARADRELQKFVTLWKGKGADLAATIRAAFPLSKAMQAAPAQITPDQNKENVTELKTDRDPIGSAHMSDLEATPRGAPSAV